MSPFIFWSRIDESPPLSGERGACTALRDPRLAGTEPCRLPGAGQDAVGLTHPLLGRAFSVISPQHAAFPPCLVPKEPLCRCALLPTPPHVGPYTPCTPFGCHLCARCDPGPLGFALLPASLSAGDAQQLPVPLPSPCVLQKFVCPGVLQGCVPAGCSAPLAIPLSGPMSPCSPSQRLDPLPLSPFSAPSALRPFLPLLDTLSDFPSAKPSAHTLSPPSIFRLLSPPAGAAPCQDEEGAGAGPAPFPSGAHPEWGRQAGNGAGAHSGWLKAAHVKRIISKAWPSSAAAKGEPALNQRPSLLLLLPNFRPACQKHAASGALQRKGHQISL